MFNIKDIQETIQQAEDVQLVQLGNLNADDEDLYLPSDWTVGYFKTIIEDGTEINCIMDGGEKAWFYDDLYRPIASIENHINDAIALGAESIEIYSYLDKRNEHGDYEVTDNVTEITINLKNGKVNVNHDY